MTPAPTPVVFHQALLQCARANKVQVTGHQRGVSMIEVLITLLVVALGVLAVIALQGLSKRNNVDSISQTIASQLAYDILERMRANSSGPALSAYFNLAPNNLPGLLAAEPTPNCRSAPCADPVQLARYDIWEWEQQMIGGGETIGGVATGGLVNPTACIDGPGLGASGLYTVTVAWRSGSQLSQIAAGDAGYVSCGAGAAVDGEALYGPGDVFRRTLSVSAYIAVR